MPIELQDLETHKGYQTKLKAEANKITAGVFVLFDKHKFKDGNKPLLLLGAKADKGLEKFVTTAGGKVKARGTCAATAEGLEFVADSGSIKTSEITSFGVHGKVKDEKAEVKDEKAEVTETGGESKQEVLESDQKVSEAEDQTSEQEQPTNPTTPTTPFQRVTPSKSQPQAKVEIGKDAREKAAQVEQFVKQRQDLLTFSQQFLETMKGFVDRAAAAAVQAKSLVERADSGEQSEKLAGSLEGALKHCQDILAAAQDAHDTNGKEVAKGRTVNPGHFIKDPVLAKTTAKKYEQIFLQVATVTQQATKANADIELALGEAIREMELAIPLVKTGKADLKNLYAYLDNNLTAVNTAVDKLEKVYNLDRTTDSLEVSLNSPKVTKEQLAVALSTSRDSVANRQRTIDESYPRIQALCKSGLTRMKQGPQTNSEIQTRFAAIKDALSKGTNMKREFDQGCKKFEGVATQAEAKINS